MILCDQQHPHRTTQPRAGTENDLSKVALSPEQGHRRTTERLPPIIPSHNMSRSNIEDEETFEPIYASQEDFNPNDTVSSFLSNTAYDPTRLHPLAGLGGSLDYLNLEDDDGGLPGTHGGIVPSRGWSDDMTYGTGMAYISGKNTHTQDSPSQTGYDQRRRVFKAQVSNLVSLEPIDQFLSINRIELGWRLRILRGSSLISKSSTQSSSEHSFELDDPSWSFHRKLCGCSG